MQAWTIQTPQVMSALSSGCPWRASQTSIPRPWLPAYRWMSREMRDRLGASQSPGQMPIWLWCQWRGAARPRPDLRARGHLPAGTPGVRIELELDDASVLRSDFELWHYALNGWYLPRSLADERDFDAHPDRRRIAPSWRRIFDLDWRDRRYTAAMARKSIQGVVWELRPEDLRGAKAFTAR
jgi:hypothetical protein